MDIDSKSLNLEENALVVPELPALAFPGLFSERLSSIYPRSVSLKAVLNELFPTALVEDYVKFIKFHATVYADINEVRDLY